MHTYELNKKRGSEVLHTHDLGVNLALRCRCIHPRYVKVADRVVSGSDELVYAMNLLKFPWVEDAKKPGSQCLMEIKQVLKNLETIKRSEKSGPFHVSQ